GWTGLRLRRKQRAVTFSIDLETKDYGIGADFRREFHAVVEIEIMHSPGSWKFDLRANHAVFISIDDRPNYLVSQWPTARGDTEVQHGKEGLPICADQEWRDSALDGRHST